MKFLLLDHYYDRFTTSWYAGHPGLASASYADQRRSFGDALFGEIEFEAAALRAMGHDASGVIVNVRSAQEAWAREHHVDLPPAHRWGLRLRRGVVPWPSRHPDPRWIGQALLEQIRDLRPDVVHVQCMDSVDPGLIAEMRPFVRFIVGQIAAPLPLERALAGYNLVVSSLPNFVARFREAGLDAEWLPLAFEPELVGRIGPQGRRIPVSFAGSVSPAHQSRAELLEVVGGHTPVEVWTADARGLRRNSPLRKHLHDAAWGAEMYRVMASSVITINSHIDVAENFANNLRLYEATGMGALLLTDQKANLGDLFVVGKEVVAFANAQECVEQLRYLLDHPAETAAIAAAGQSRTLREHTWRDRMERLANMVEARM